jgi:hypothetical protein
VVKIGTPVNNKERVRLFLPNKSRDNYRLFVFTTSLLEYKCDYSGLYLLEQIKYVLIVKSGRSTHLVAGTLFIERGALCLGCRMFGILWSLGKKIRLRIRSALFPEISETNKRIINARCNRNIRFELLSILG